MAGINQRQLPQVFECVCDQCQQSTHGLGNKVKYPLFAAMGEGYPHALEERYDRVLAEIERLWDSSAIDDYFSDLLLDKRGGRKGFPADVLADIVRLSRYHEMFALKQAERREDAKAELARRGIEANTERFLDAVDTGDKELLDLLLRAGVNIHVKLKDGTPPIILAIIKGYTVVANMLLKAGVEVNDRDRRGLTPLLLTCGKPVEGYKILAEALIKKGAVVNVRDSLGNTPLLLALSGGSADIAELLIERGADIFVSTRSGESPLSLARNSGKTYLVNLLLAKSKEMHAKW
jgi:tankyrase